MNTNENDIKLTLLSEGKIFGNQHHSKLEVIKKYGTQAAITDLCILTGSYLCNDKKYNIPEDEGLKGRTSWFWTMTYNHGNDVRVINRDGTKSTRNISKRTGAIRPVLKSPTIFSELFPYKTVGYNEVEEVVYGEYPQYAVSAMMQSTLESKYINGLKKTGRNYTFDLVRYNDRDAKFIPNVCDEYEYKGQKYIRIMANTFYNQGELQLSNGEVYKFGDYVWVKVSPVKWLIDSKEELLISKFGLVSGIRFLGNGAEYKGVFGKTEMKEYLDKYMLHDLTQTATITSTRNMTLEKRKQFEKKRNPYKFNMDKVSEEDIIRGSIESGVAVFLHGPSSEGKSARVKQIDPTCEIIYLRNASPESLNGKSVYNQNTGEIIDVKPSWLKRVEEKCKKEPDKLHIVFLDEITNALPSIQGIAFNIVLDREVNGKWKLPDNARIVAAGNDVKDSLAANELAEPLFNRFAHVYITTTKESWLKWASENNIHPAIYAYIAYKDGKTLRSKYDGKKPNADPRKWEMASKMLYQTNNPEMLRALVGDDITKEFVEFCNQRVITVEDVINGNYTEEEIEELNTSERYATTMGLSQVGIEEVEKVREFVKKIGPEFIKIFDVLWTHNDEERLEKLAEINTSQDLVKGLRR